jgi:putative transposase
MVLKAFKMRIYPNVEQREQLKQTFGAVHFVWNQMLDMQIERFKNNPSASYLNNFAMDHLLKQLKKEYLWLKNAESTALQSANRHLDDAFKRFFKNQNKFPKFKSKKYAQSYTSKCVNQNIRVIDNHHIKVPKLGVVSCRSGRFPEGKLKRITIRKNTMGQYYVSILAECEDRTLPKTGKRIGGDLGLKSLINLSDGLKEPLIRYDKQLEEKLHVWERKLARRRLEALKRTAFKEINSFYEAENYQRARKQVAKWKQKIANQRVDHLQKYTTKLVKHYDVIVLEKLNVKGLLKNHKLARSISNASWSKLITMLFYKCKWYGKELIQVNPSYTSQICSECDSNNHRLGLTQSDWLSVREWTCSDCGTHHDRDINAAKNILNKGIKQLELA